MPPWRVPQARPTDLRGIGRPSPGRGSSSGAATRQTKLLAHGAFPRPGTAGHFRRWDRMDSQSKREIWFLAIGTILVEMPIVAIAALVLATH